MKSPREYNNVFVQQAIIRWHGFDTRSSITQRDLYEFADFLGYPYKVGDENIVDTSNPEVIRLIDLINGPNGNTILKMMEIKNREKDANDPA